MKLCKHMLIILNILLLFTGIYMVLSLLQNTMLKYMLVSIILSLGLINLGNYLYFRRRFICFSNEMCQNTEKYYMDTPSNTNKIRKHLPLK